MPGVRPLPTSHQLMTVVAEWAWRVMLLLVLMNIDSNVARLLQRMKR